MTQFGAPTLFGLSPGPRKFDRHPKFVQLNALYTAAITLTDVFPKVGIAFSARRSTLRSAKPHVFGGVIDREKGCVARRFSRLKPCVKSSTFVYWPEPNDAIVLSLMSIGSPKMPVAV